MITEELIKELYADTSDEWQIHEGTKTVSVMVNSAPFTRVFTDIFGEDFYDIYDDGWIDVYAVIDVDERKVVFFDLILVSNRADNAEWNLPIGVTNDELQRKAYKVIDGSTNGELSAWIDEDAVKELDDYDNEVKALEFLKNIQSGTDYYNPKEETYVFVYSDRGSICIYSIDPDKAKELAEKSAENDGEYWGAFLGCGGEIFDDMSYDEPPAPCNSNIAFCRDAVTWDGWMTCEEFAKSKGIQSVA